MECHASGVTCAVIEGCRSCQPARNTHHRINAEVNRFSIIFLLTAFFTYLVCFAPLVQLSRPFFEWICEKRGLRRCVVTASLQRRFDVMLLSLLRIRNLKKRNPREGYIILQRMSMAFWLFGGTSMPTKVFDSKKHAGDLVAPQRHPLTMQPRQCCDASSINRPSIIMIHCCKERENFWKH